MKLWLVNLYNAEPLLYQEEAQARFIRQFSIMINACTVWKILREAGLTWKVLEQRALQISYQDIVRFTDELIAIPWLLHNLVFLDEVSFDDRDILRRHGYCRRGKKLIHCGEFCRKPRVSLLCFLGMNGVLDTFMTEGTFTRWKFVDCLRQFGTSGLVKQYPGEFSVWIMDGARIHCHPNIVYYLRSLGIIPLFLPAYCPFYNPIEYLFGLVKRKFKRLSYSRRPQSTEISASEALLHFANYNFKPMFSNCGYVSDGQFNPGIGLEQEVDTIGFSAVNDSC
ncbi:hypothetical protein AeMF1_013536 [Aphanomyces euteiches]|nr:hypothetical protein AeMF1_013536 [Aphanomyces euteiches]